MTSRSILRPPKDRFYTIAIAGSQAEKVVLLTEET